MLCMGVVLLLLSACSRQTLAYDNSDDILDLSQSTYDDDENAHKLRLWLTISAQRRFLEVSWRNAPGHDDDHILITSQEPYSFEKVHVKTPTVPLAKFDVDVDGSGSSQGNAIPIDGYTTPSSRKPIRRDTENYGPLFDNDEEVEESSGFASSTATSLPQQYWSSNNGLNEIVAALKPSQGSQWFTTGVHFDYALSRNVTKHTKCYGYWASYINDTGTILATTCLRAHPTWMHDLHSVVSGLRVRDLFIPGTHDSGSYRPNFHPLERETIVTKYALCQDDDIRGQLMHGIRYLDIRVGYYRNTPELFFINHGITRQRPLLEVIEQVKAFVEETNEIVIFGLKEFPVGFGRNLGVHRLLVQYLRTQFGNLLVHPSLRWTSTLRDIWTSGKNVILAYDKAVVQQEFSELLFIPVEQRWGNVQNWTKLEKYLIGVNNFDISRLSSRPVADMAELTPDTWGVILDKYGGLRKMADNVNWRISQLYMENLGARANIVAVDFYRGTNIVETALDWNKRKVIY